MSLWNRLFGSKPKTIDDELLEAALKLGKKLGQSKTDTERTLQLDLTLFSKEQVLASYREVLADANSKKK